MNIIKFIFHADKYLYILINKYGLGVYIILFLIIFLETGLVITPFFPGDSLLFITGTFAGAGILNLFFVLITLISAAIIGDSVNYFIGSYFGEKIFLKSKLLKKEYLDKTKNFYKKHGGKTIILARFTPLIRTFAPFVAGICKMDYKKFFIYNVTGAILWVSIFVYLGYYFGKIEFVKNHLTFITLTVIILSLTPFFIEFIKQTIKQRNN